MRKLAHNLLVPIALTLANWPGQAQAWGPEGHEIVARIASYYLTPAARERVDEILGTQRLYDYEVASWPDLVRGTKEYEAIYPGNGSWHFVDFNATQYYDDTFELKPPADGQDIVSQVHRWHDVLAFGDITPEQRLDALRFLVHFTGDIHQPLHCAYRYGDMGGNMIPVHSFQGRHFVTGPDTEQDYTSSIHSVWDDAMVRELMAGKKPAAAAKELRQAIPDEQLAKWRTDDPLQWAVDSYWRARKEVYRWTNGEKLPFKWSGPGMDLTSENYIDSHLPIVREQLQKAGVRLGHLLNLAFDPAYAAAYQPAPKAKAKPAPAAK